MKYDFEELMKENMNIQETPSKELKERILYYDREEKVMRDKKKFYRHIPKAAAAVAAAVLLGGGIAYASSGLWNHFVAKDFGVENDQETMKDMNEKGFAQQPQAKEGEKGSKLSVTDQDITVTVQQTLADEHSAYICYEVKYGEQYKPVKKGTTEISDTGLAYPEWTYLTMDSGQTLNYSGGVSKIVDDHTILYDAFLTTSDREETLKDGVINMSISSFAMDRKKCDDHPKILAKDGKWDLSWNLSVGTEKRVYHLDRTLTLGKDHIVLKDLEITPLSCDLTMEYPDGVTLGEIGAIVEDTGEVKMEDRLDENGDLKVIRYIRTGGEEYVDGIMEKLPKGQTLYGTDVMYLRLGDKDFDGDGGMGMTGGSGLFEQFDKILDLEQLSGIRVAGKYVDLTAEPYETSK